MLFYILRNYYIMCYSIESSLRTSSMSLLAIIYLLSSGIPKFQYLGVVLFGWCLMQLTEAFLWMTDPRKCTTMNKFLTLFIIPIPLILQIIAPIFGSLFIEPWNENKGFKIGYSVFIILTVLIYRHIINPIFYTYKDCTTISPDGHLNWDTAVSNYKESNLINVIGQIVWTILIFIPLLKFWKGKRFWPFYMLVIIGMIISLSTDSPASIWCNVTSYTSIIASLLLFLNNIGIKILD